MSVLQDMAGKRFWLAILLTAVTALVVTALGAVLVVIGLLPVAKAWMAVCAAWAIAGLLGGRFAVRGKDQRLVRSVVNIVLTAALLWLAGLTTPAESAAGEMGRLWFLGCGLLGAVAAVGLPQKKKRRAKGKRVLRSPGK